MIRRPPRSTLDRSSAASDVYKRQEEWLSFKKIGETRDDAVGEAFDKVARMLGLPYPGCLLYTSPSPRDRTRSRMPSSD